MNIQDQENITRMAMTFQEKIDVLEASLGAGTVSGTALNRVLMDKTLLAEHGIESQQEDRESALVWCLAVGGLMQPWKQFYYGRTIDEAVNKALEASNL